MNWIITKLGKLIDIKHGFAFKGEFFCDAGEYILLTPGNCLEKGGLKLKREKEIYYNGNFPREYLLRTGDLLIVMTDLVGTAPVLGGAFKIPEDNLFLHNQRLGLVKILDEQSIDKDYLYYLLNSRYYRGQIRGSASGATVRHTSPGRIKKCKVKIPVDKNIQQKIGKILLSYDDLIDINRRRIQLLEEATRLLFREWFVHFRFPGHEKVKIVDGVPVGWERKKLNRFVSFFGGHAFKRVSYKQEGKYGIVTIKNVQQNNFIHKCTDYLDYAPNSMRKHCFLINGDILISLTGNVGRVCLVYGENYLLNQRVAKIEVKNKIPKSFIYWMFDNSLMQKRVENLSYGAAQQNLSPIKLGEQKVILPPDLLLESFDEIISLINIEIIQLLTQNKKLAQARDLLLPRLMSGEIEV